MDAIIVEGMTTEMTLFDFPEEVDTAFTTGDCWHLARTIHLLTGYPVVTFQHFDYGQDLWAHAGNRLPDGRIVDIEGILPEQTWLDQWSHNVDADPDTVYAREWSLAQWDGELEICDFDFEYPEVSNDVSRYAQEVIAHI